MEVILRRDTVGQFLQDKRIEKGLTQFDVAKKLKYTTPQFISNWERGLALPPMDALPILVKLYGIVPDEMINIIMSYQEKVMQMQRKNLDKLLKKRSAS